MSVLYVPNSVALRNFDAVFKNNSMDFSDSRVEVDFHPKYVAMHPVGLALYAALSDFFRANRCNVNAKINPRISSIPYLQRMGLFRAFGFADPVPTKEHEESGRFIPLMRIQTPEELEDFLRKVDPILHTNRENSRIIKHVFSELLRNVLEHSDAPFGGNVCATYNRKKRKISIGISDAGKGLHGSLRRFHSVSSDREAILSALKPGISGMTARIGGTPENAGAGLFFTKCIAQSTRNHFLLYSGDAYFKLNLTPRGEETRYNAEAEKDRSSIRDSLPRFTGTLVGIDINIDDTDAFKDLMIRIGKAYTSALKKGEKDHYRRIRFT